MHASVYLPLFIAGLFGLTAPRLALRLPPAAATWLLSVGGLIAAAGAAASLTLLGFTLVAQAQPLAESGHWSITALRHEDPVPRSPLLRSSRCSSWRSDSSPRASAERALCLPRIGWRPGSRRSVRN